MRGMVRIYEPVFLFKNTPALFFESTTFCGLPVRWPYAIFNISFSSRMEANWGRQRSFAQVLRLWLNSLVEYSNIVGLEMLGLYRDLQPGWHTDEYLDGFGFRFVADIKLLIVDRQNSICILFMIEYKESIRVLSFLNKMKLVCKCNSNSLL